MTTILHIQYLKVELILILHCIFCFLFILNSSACFLFFKGMLHFIGSLLAFWHVLKIIFTNKKEKQEFLLWDNTGEGWTGSKGFILLTAVICFTALVFIYVLVILNFKMGRICPTVSFSNGLHFLSVTDIVTTVLCHLIRDFPVMHKMNHNNDRWSKKYVAVLTAQAAKGCFWWWQMVDYW